MYALGFREVPEAGLLEIESDQIGQVVVWYFGVVEGYGF